jgi:23S rRNA (pseudouridine1915-N3)-methyltransferase
VYTSPDLAAQLRAWIDSGCQQLLFIIEPPDLLTPIAEADQTLAISPLDLPTELAALLLAEQIYRAYRIIDNQPYHK